MDLPRLTCPECWGEGTVEVPALSMAHEADTEIERCPECGGEKRVQVEECPDCRGEGEVEGICPNCNGIGTRYPERNGGVCSRCGGGGRYGMVDCDSCDGVGVKVPGPGPGKLVPLPLELLAELVEWEDGAERENSQREAMEDVA